MYMHTCVLIHTLRTHMCASVYLRIYVYTILTYLCVSIHTLAADREACSWVRTSGTTHARTWARVPGVRMCPSTYMTHAHTSQTQYGIQHVQALGALPYTARHTWQHTDSCRLFLSLLMKKRNMCARVHVHASQHTMHDSDTYTIYTRNTLAIYPWQTYHAAHTIYSARTHARTHKHTHAHTNTRTHTHTHTHSLSLTHTLT